MNEAERRLCEEIPNIEAFCRTACDACEGGGWSCPSWCDTLEKARKMPFEKIKSEYIRNGGDFRAVWRYIKQYRGAGR